MLCGWSQTARDQVMSASSDLYFFKCSVSEDLYGASPNADGSPLPTPGGGKWLVLHGLEALGSAQAGFDKETAMSDISRWGCHWFTTAGPREIYWGEDGPPTEILKTGS